MGCDRSSAVVYVLYIATFVAVLMATLLIGPSDMSNYTFIPFASVSRYDMNQTILVALGSLSSPAHPTQLLDPESLDPNFLVCKDNPHDPVRRGVGDWFTGQHFVISDFVVRMFQNVSVPMRLCKAHVDAGSASDHTNAMKKIMDSDYRLVLNAAGLPVQQLIYDAKGEKHYKTGIAVSTSEGIISHLELELWRNGKHVVKFMGHPTYSKEVTSIEYTVRWDTSSLTVASALDAEILRMRTSQNELDLSYASLIILSLVSFLIIAMGCSCLYLSIGKNDHGSLVPHVLKGLVVGITNFFDSEAPAKDADVDPQFLADSHFATNTGWIFTVKLLNSPPRNPALFVAYMGFGRQCAILFTVMGIVCFLSIELMTLRAQLATVGIPMWISGFMLSGFYAGRVCKRMLTDFPSLQFKTARRTEEIMSSDWPLYAKRFMCLVANTSWRAGIFFSMVPTVATLLLWAVVSIMRGITFSGSGLEIAWLILLGVVATTTLIAVPSFFMGNWSWHTSLTYKMLVSGTCGLADQAEDHSESLVGKSVEESPVAAGWKRWRIGLPLLMGLLTTVLLASCVVVALQQKWNSTTGIYVLIVLGLVLYMGATIVYLLVHVFYALNAHDVHWEWYTALFSFGSFPYRTIAILLYTIFGDGIKGIGSVIWMFSIRLTVLLMLHMAEAYVCYWVAYKFVRGLHNIWAPPQ